MTIQLTAEQAYGRYSDFLARDALVQAHWHVTNGRELACGLGALDPNINSPADCPSSVMPRWLAQMVPWFFDNQPFEDAKTWGLSFYAELKRLGGEVPFSVVHDWHANVVGPMNVAICEARKWDASLPAAVTALHVRALTGDRAPRTEWFEALRPSFKQAAYIKQYADADVGVDAGAYAYAYADADADAYAYAYAYAYADADADADAYADADADADAYRAKIKLLADGMVECLRRVPVRG